MDELKQSLTSYAYNITGSYEDAKDVVQDVLLQTLHTPEENFSNKKAYLTKAVINRAINLKKKQQRMRSSYPGEWLPEPVATETADKEINHKDILQYSLMVLLEKLNARQRAVFILKEAFDYEHEEIAAVLNITVENSRKLLSRARKELKSNDVSTVSRAPADYLNKYMTIISNGDTGQLEKLLAEEVTFISDGGGKVAAAIKPVSGKKPVMSMLLGLYKKFYTQIRIEQGIINHLPALFYYHNNTLVNCQVFSFENGMVNRIWFIRNPDKLKALQ